VGSGGQGVFLEACLKTQFGVVVLRAKCNSKSRSPPPQNQVFRGGGSASKRGLSNLDLRRGEPHFELPCSNFILSNDSFPGSSYLAAAPNLNLYRTILRLMRSSCASDDLKRAIHYVKTTANKYGIAYLLVPPVRRQTSQFAVRHA